MVPIGIKGIEVYIPAPRLTAEAMASSSSCPAEQITLQTGVVEKAIGAPGDTPTVMALKAAKCLLQRVRAHPDTIDFIIFAGSGVHEKRFWSPAAKVQAGLGAGRAFAFDVCNGCNAGNLGMSLAAGLLRGTPGSGIALLVVADTLACLVNYSDPGHLPLFNFADAATAVLVEKGAERLQLLTFSAVTQAEFVDCLSLPESGRLIERSVDAATKQRLSNAYQNNYNRVIQQACDDAGVSPRQMRRLFINQGDYRLIDKIAEAFGLAPEVPFRSYERLGHLGGTDVFFGLRTCLDHGGLQRGDIVALATSAIGFSWGCTIIRV
ncbi:MAG TPA: 3-oxoacyl-[acyl-carrier-protein] synthase III C-terminal domain-containing protein [Gemmataceae bacterium]|jgi:3-oxoacyl-[acyl-carrier-protein] synthase-3|nr:3-oxoacyl-[acyl-carrier-protein] synthase III C-terminal domain-containing protein [Gemmataceae bacterium]